jgi:hypothetical protein
MNSDLTKPGNFLILVVGAVSAGVITGKKARVNIIFEI